MRDPESGVEVYVRAFLDNDEYDGEQYTEYEVPRGTPLYTGCLRERYIEATTDERYEIVVVLHPEFDFKGERCVRAKVGIDGSLWLSRRFYIEDRHPGSPMKQYLNGFASIVGGECHFVGISFGKISLNDELDLSPEDEVWEARNRGKITITLERGAEIDAFGIGRARKDVVSLSEETNKTVAMQHGKSHGLKQVVMGKVDAPHRQRRFTATHGRGEAVTFRFYYTSRMILEMKNIVVSAPSSEAGTASSAGPEPLPRKPPFLKRRATVNNQDVMAIWFDRDDDDILPRTNDRSRTREILRRRVSSNGEKKRVGSTEDAHLLNDYVEPSRQKKTKISASKHDQSSKTTSALSNVSTNAPLKSIEMTTPQDQSDDLHLLSGRSNIMKQSKKSKEKSRLMLESEEIKIRKRLQELEDNEED